MDWKIICTALFIAGLNGRGFAQSPDIGSLLDSYDIVWTTPGSTSAASMPVGNGDIGLNVWIEADGSLDFYIGKTDAWSEDLLANDQWGGGNWGPLALLKLGKVHVSLSPNSFNQGTAFTQVLRLHAGEIEIQEGSGITLLVWVDANHPVIRMEVTSTSPVSLTATLNDWRTTPEGDVSADTILNLTNQIAWYHQNASTADPHVAKLVFGALMQGAGLISRNSTTLTSSTPSTYQVLSVYPLTASSTSTNASQWLSQLQQQASNLSALDIPSSRAAHETWWDNFWHRSWIFLSSNTVTNDTMADPVTQGYVLQRFMNACSGRGAYPIKFNGSIFVVDNPSFSPSAVTADYRTWGGQYWFQNTRASYWPRLQSGDFDFMLPLFNMYLNQLPGNEAQVQQYYHHSGAYFAETAPFWGGLNNLTGVQGSYTVRYFTGILEQTMMMLDYYDYTGDSNFAKQTLVPIATQGMLFFNQHWGLDSSSHYLLSPDNSIETFWDVSDPAPDIAGLTAVLPRLLALPSSVVDPTTRSAWTAMLSKIPPLPTGINNNTTVLLPYTGPQTATSRNFENPELYAVYPFRLFGLDKPNLQMAINTFNVRQYAVPGDWDQDPIQAAMLGITSVAEQRVYFDFTNFDSRQKFPGFWASGSDYTPCQPNGDNGENGLQQMLMQIDGKAIMLLPAWPAGWDATFKLNAPYQTTVEGSIVQGQLTNLVVTPTSRMADVINLSPLLGVEGSVVSPQDNIVGLQNTVAGGANTLAQANNYGGTLPSSAIDGYFSTKYFNNAPSGSNPPGVNTGFVITPASGPAVVNAIAFVTAGDTPGRDPLNITVEGSNSATANQTGDASFTLLHEGQSGLQQNPARGSWGQVIHFQNSLAYASYRVLVTSTAAGASGDGTQFAEVKMLGPGGNNAGQSLVEASSYNDVSLGIKTESCSEGGLDVAFISPGSYTGYYYLNLNDVTFFSARTANPNSAGTITVHLDSTAGPVIGTCPVPTTGGYQTWSTQQIPISGVTGFHKVYLVYSGGFNIEGFSFQKIGTVIEAYSFYDGANVQRETSSEGQLDVGYTGRGSFTHYPNLNLNNASKFKVRIANPGTGGASIAIHLDSQSGPLVGTCPVPITGGGQAWSTQECGLTGVTGYHDVYLVYSGGFNVEWFSFEGASTNIPAGSCFYPRNTGPWLEGCSEGGVDAAGLGGNDYLVFRNVDLNGVVGFAMRQASDNETNPGMVGIHLDSPTGTLIGTCNAAYTGGWQAWTTQSCSLSQANGVHNVYLVFNSGGINVEWIHFQQAPPNIPGSSGTLNPPINGPGLESCSESGLDVAGLSGNDYVKFGSVNLNGATSFAMRVASAASGTGTVTIHLDSPTGTVIGTCSAPNSGGWQTWETESCSLTPVGGVHDVYLVFNSAGTSLEWLSFFPWN